MSGRRSPHPLVRTNTLRRLGSTTALKIGAAITVVADAASVGSDAGSIRHDVTVIAAPVLTAFLGFASPGPRDPSYGHVDVGGQP